VAVDRSVEGVVIEVVGVSRSYGDVHAVVDVSFGVDSGEVVGLLGPNGAGKTTILRMLATLLSPDAGHLRVAGFDVRAAPLEVRSRLGYQTGDTGLYSRLKPAEFLRYFGRLHGLAPARLEARISELVASFGIDAFADRLCGNLSTGQKQRVSLARALLNDPPVLVLDEPTSGLDIVSSGFILEALRRAADEQRAVLFSTHILSEIELICDRVVILHRGRVLANAPIPEVLATTGHDTLSRAFLHLIEQLDAAPAAEEAV
jgi:sodium transport system ATP-binding protein